MASPALLAPSRADATDAEPGLTLADLIDRARTSTDSGTFPYALERVLGDEVERGRVVLDDDRYRLVPDAFDQGVLTALRALVL